MEIKDLTSTNNFFLLAGPCVIEGEDMAMRIAEHVVKVTERLKIPYVFKGSYRKANRSRLDSFTGIGDEKALVDAMKKIAGDEGYASTISESAVKIREELHADRIAEKWLELI